MNKFYSFLISLALQVLILFAFMNIYLHYFVTLTPIQDNIIYSSEEDLMAKIEFIAMKVAYANNYSKSYDCSAFSRDVALNLSAEGISATCVSGAYICDGIVGHTFIEIMVNGKVIGLEATSGELINKTEYENCYKSVVKGYCL